MICQRCDKNEATVHLTKIINGEKTELFLCEECAEKTGKISFDSDNPFSFQNLLAGILNPDVDSSFTDTGKQLKCDNCGMTYQEFSRQGLFGCSECYQTFGDRLDPLVKRIHSSNQHQGKVPKRRGGDLLIERKIDNLREEMQEAVDRENFERAAELRDDIHELEQELGG